MVGLSSVQPYSFMPAKIPVIIRRKNSAVTFEGKPKILYPSSDYILTYNNFKNGSYLDVHDDYFAPENKYIRAENLRFLDKISSEKDKIKFIESFEQLTGFPNLKTVSEKIENEFIKTIKNISNGIDAFECVAAGYDGTCSVGKRLSLPGSDLDKAIVLIKGTGNIYEDEKIINDYKSELWKNTDQRILSFNHHTSFPTVMTIAKLKYFLENINYMTFSVPIDDKTFKSLIENEYNDVENGAQYNILVSNCFPKAEYGDSALVMNKENVKNFAFFLESLRDGKIVINSDDYENVVNDISKYDFYKYSNVAQMRAMKNAVSSGREQKKKIILRKSLESDFRKWDIDKQFNFIKTLIKYSCEDEDNFLEYFSNDRNIKTAYQSLLGQITKGDGDEYIEPEFHYNYNYINLVLGKNKAVNLYHGFYPNILWIDSNNSDIIKEVLFYIDKIKNSRMFNCIDRIQCPCPDNFIKDFERTNHHTADGQLIYEMRLK